MLIAKIKSPKPAQASLKVTNYPITGPILSGPHLTPYECRTVESGLGEPLDADCSAKQKIEYFYRASNNTFKPLANPTGPRPTDMVNTTTNDGKTAPYIVRVDSGTINRSIYRIAILDDPNPETSSVNGDQGEWTPGAGWNRKLAVVGVGTEGQPLASAEGLDLRKREVFSEPPGQRLPIDSLRSFAIRKARRDIGCRPDFVLVARNQDAVLGRD